MRTKCVTLFKDYDIQAEVLKKEPKTYTEAEDTERLIYSIQQSTLQRKDVSRIVQAANCVPSTTNTGATPAVQDALARIQHQLDNVMSTMAKTPSKSEAAANAYQYSPQDPNVLYDKVSRLEQRMQQILSVVGTGPKIAAYQPIIVQSADEELRYLQEQVRQLRGLNSEEHFNAAAAYQPSTREHNRSNSESEEMQHLKEETRLLKLAQGGLQQQQPQQFQNRMNYDSQDAFQERMMNEMRRMQARLDGFM